MYTVSRESTALSLLCMMRKRTASQPTATMVSMAASLLISKRAVFICTSLPGVSASLPICGEKRQPGDCHHIKGRPAGQPSFPAAAGIRRTAKDPPAGSREIGMGIADLRQPQRGGYGGYVFPRKPEARPVQT
jgi:hypothetical protein